MADNITNNNAASMVSDTPPSSAAPSPLFMHSSPPDGEAEGDTLMRAADTPLESSPAPTGLTIESGRKRKYSEEEEDEGPKKKGKAGGKGRKVGGTGKSKKGIDARIIPRTFEECEDIDKKLISLRDGGASWQDVRRMWKQETGEDAGKSTLPNRYMRLKVNFTVIADKDNALLLKCHREVEEAFEKERWSLVSKAMQREGTEVYLPEVLSRQFKKLLHQGANLRAGLELGDGLEEEGTQ